MAQTTVAPLSIALCQIAPVWLDREATLTKVVQWVERAADQGAHLAVFGEALVPGYPFWVEHTDGARFESALQKELYAHYLDQGVCPEDGHLDGLRDLARARGIDVVVGCMERALDRGGHSLYCGLVWIAADGELRPVHRKLMPTHEERLVWATGDGHGLRTHRVGPFTAGALLCWENWMPLCRAALQAMGEDLHLMLWPGDRRNTEDITRFCAREGRSYVVSVSGLMRRSDVGDGVPRAAELRAALPAVAANGGSCAVGPDGAWVLEPITAEESLRVVVMDPAAVRRERQNFDPAGHYARPDVLRLSLDRTRQVGIEIVE